MKAWSKPKLDIVTYIELMQTAQLFDDRVFSYTLGGKLLFSTTIEGTWYSCEAREIVDGLLELNSTHEQVVDCLVEHIAQRVCASCNVLADDELELVHAECMNLAFAAYREERLCDDCCEELDCSFHYEEYQ